MGFLDVIDSECLNRAAALVEYRLKVIKFIEPIEAENKQGRIQKEIIRELRQNGGMMKKRDLCRELNYTSLGTDVWYAAYVGLLKNKITVEFRPNNESRPRVSKMLGLLKDED